MQVSFAPSAPGDFTGTLTLTDSTAAGTHTVALSGTGVPVPPSTSIRTDHTTYAFGQVATVTAHLSGTYSTAQVSIYKKVGSGSRVLVSTRDVNSSGNAVVSVAVTEKTTFSVDWTYGITSLTSSATVLVHAKVKEVMARYRERSGTYYLYTPGKRLYTVALTTPVKPGQCLTFRAQVRYRGAWRNLGRTGCVRMTSKGAAAAYLGYTRALLGRPLRFKATYGGDARNLAQTSVWRYAKWVR